MANYFTTPNMDLTVPYVNVDPGPDYASNINNSLTLIDTHDHSSGKGVQITPSGLNINAALTFGGNPATNLSYLNLNLQSASPGVSQSLFVQNGSESPARPDLWYNDGTTNIQLTNNGSVNATIASLPGESYGAGTFTWKQGTGSTIPAAFDIGSITIRPNVAATTNGITLQTGSISSSWTLTLPALPLVTSFLQLDSSGNITSGPAVNGLTTSNLSASANIAGTQLAANTVTPDRMSSSGFTASVVLSGSTTSTSTTLSYVALGSIALPANYAPDRPIFIKFVSSDPNNPAYFSATNASTGTGYVVESGFSISVKAYQSATTFWQNNELATTTFTNQISSVVAGVNFKMPASVYNISTDVSANIPSTASISVAIAGYSSNSNNTVTAAAANITMIIFQV